MNSDQSAALEIHQKARAELSIAPLEWDSKLATDAQQYADHLASTDNGMQHSNQLRQQGQGENLACCPGHWPNAYTESSKIWYAEKKDWKGGVFQAQSVQAVGHYTQMIWSGTTHIGMGLAVSSSGTTYVVARYSPPGNCVGQSPSQNAKSGGANKPTQGKKQRPGQRDSGRARRPVPGRQQWPGQRDSGSMQWPPPYQPFMSGLGGNGWPGAYPQPPPQSGILGPQDFNQYMTNPYLRNSPYNPLGPMINPDMDFLSANNSKSTGCCVIL